MAWTRTRAVIVVIACLLLAIGTATLLIIRSNDPIATAKRLVARHEAEPLDLKSYYASTLGEPNPNSAFGTTPRGFQAFANVPLEIGGIISLWGDGMATKFKANLPKEVSDIAVRRKFETLYVYHGAYFVSPDGTPVCQVVFRYEDGSSVTNQMLYGDDVLDWVGKPAHDILGPSGPNSIMAWVGGSFEPPKERPLRFCLTALENPKPKLEVTFVDLYSCKSRTTPCIMAMTTGRSGLLKERRRDQKNWPQAVRRD